MADIERRTLKTKRAYDDAYERLRQHLQPPKEKESGIKRLQHKIAPKVKIISSNFHVNFHLIFRRKQRNSKLLLLILEIYIFYMLIK